MNIPPDSQPEPVLLIIADISGYTRYMTANAKTLVHSQIIITELVKAIVEEIKLPLEVAKLEGDAVFLVGRKSQTEHPWPEARRKVGDNLLSFFRSFSRKLNELTRAVTCGCNACAHIESLKLKIVIHSGEALFHRVLNFVELAGVDVIIVHRLLKNSLAAQQYLLLTDAGCQDVEFSEPLALTNHREIYEDIGLIKAQVYIPPEAMVAVPVVAKELTFSERYGEAWRLFLKLWFAPISSRGKSSAFHHISTGANAAGRTLLGLFTLVLTPLFLPVGAALVLYHSLRPAPVHQHADGHVHKPDGSCCHDH